VRRITRGDEIRALTRRGKRSRTAHLDVFASASPCVFPRAAVVVPKYGHGGVERNQVKRRVRELLRREVLPVLEQNGLVLDVLVRVRRDAYGARYAVLQKELTEWVERRCPRGP
jgi:ribonuclease P protein component